MTSTLADLEGRLHRLESSVIFRFLRWLGPRIGVIPRVAGAKSPGGAPEQEYAESAKEVALFRRALSQLRVRPAEWGRESTVSIVIDARELSQPRFERVIQAIAEQAHQERELFVSVAAEPPAWLEESLAANLAGRLLGHRWEILVEGEAPRWLQRALERCTGEFVAVLTSATVLEPDALDQLVRSATEDVVAVYSDWDHMDAAGRFHSPRFTPELSLELLQRTAYWGQCYLVRTAWLRQLTSPEDATALACLHALSLRLAETQQPIRRVPRMLWHAQTDSLEGTGPAPVSPPPLSSGSGQVSVIVCSRNPEQLAPCLEAILPTLGPRHELIVVAHGQGGKGSVLEQIAARHQVQSVRYDGPFHFGLMNYLGVAQSSGEVLCLLNDDVRPIAPDWLELMQAQAERPDVGVVGALLLYPDQTIQHAGVVIGGGVLPTHVGRLLTESPYWPWLRMTREVTAVTGACVVLRRDVWDELGGFDLRFPVNYNDIDLCLRAAERGYRILIEAGAVMIHPESQTRTPVVFPEEASMFRELWNHVVLNPDRFFNPQLDLGGTLIGLRNMQPLARRAGIDEEIPPPRNEERAFYKAGASH